MKTELEWVNVKIGLPTDGTTVICIIDDKRPFTIMAYRFENEWKTHWDVVHGDMNSMFLRNNITHWAYVNLPEENKPEEKMKCFKCGLSENIYRKTCEPLTPGYICKSCWEEPFKTEEPAKETFRSHEFRNYPTDAEGWIWPLKQLPEEGQKVEVKIMNDEVNQKGFFDGTWFKSSYCCEVMEHECDKFIFDDVIAWRPLMEEMKTYQCQDCHKSFKNKEIMMFCDECKGIKNKAEPHKPDFSKLKEGDLIVVHLKKGHTLIGFFFGYHIICEVGSVIISNIRETITSKEIGKIECSKIKKIIRINIDKPVTFVNDYVKTYYRFEEI